MAARSVSIVVVSYIDILTGNDSELYADVKGDCSFGCHETES